MKVAIYARVSTSEQRVEMQTAALEHFCLMRGWTIVKAYIDAGVSGSKESRRGLDDLLRDAHRKKFEAVVVWKLDRLGRSLKHLINVLNTLENLKIAFVSTQDNIDMTTPAGKLMFHLIGAMAEFERSLIRERVKAGIEHARSRGQVLGRPMLPGSGNLSDLVKAHRANGMSWRRIAKTLNIGEGTARRYARL